MIFATNWIHILYKGLQLYLQSVNRPQTAGFVNYDSTDLKRVKSVPKDWILKSFPNIVSPSLTHLRNFISGLNMLLVFYLGL